MSPSIVPVSPHDRVSDVLARDDSLIDVFVRAAPHFEKLRNRAMRRVMASLVTVEQAARTANIPVERLVRELNAALAVVDDQPAATASAPHVAPSADRHPPHAPVFELDVRDDLRSGREPFSRIMSAIAALRHTDVLCLRAPFEPAPLFALLRKRGFIHETISHAADDWSVWFWRPAVNTSTRCETATVNIATDRFATNDVRSVVLDVRGLDPPEPMMRTLAALETLGRECTLIQINSRVPRFLLPMLSERGFAWEIDESQPDHVVVRIFHIQ